MLPYRDNRLTYIALGFFFLIVLGYAYYEAQGILFGPSITVTSKTTEVHEPFIRIKGQANRIASLSMNGKEIPVTETGAFEEPYLLAPGYNRIVLNAQDKYGREGTRTIEVVYILPAAETPEKTVATSTSPMDESASSTVSASSTGSEEAGSPQSPQSTSTP